MLHTIIATELILPQLSSRSVLGGRGDESGGEEGGQSDREGGEEGGEEKASRGEVDEAQPPPSQAPHSADKVPLPEQPPAILGPEEAKEELTRILIEAFYRYVHTCCAL